MATVVIYDMTTSVVRRVVVADTLSAWAAGRIGGEAEIPVSAANMTNIDAIITGLGLRTQAGDISRALR